MTVMGRRPDRLRPELEHDAKRLSCIEKRILELEAQRGELVQEREKLTYELVEVKGAGRRALARAAGIDTRVLSKRVDRLRANRAAAADNAADGAAGDDTSQAA